MIRTVISTALIILIAFSSITGCGNNASNESHGKEIEVTRGDDGHPVLWNEGNDTPVKATYSFSGCFKQYSFMTEDEEFIKALESAIREIEISKAEASYAYTADTTITFEMANGDEYIVHFTDENFAEYCKEICDGVDMYYPTDVYKTKGFDLLESLLDEGIRNKQLKKS